jgi:hypothetical protein
MLVAILASTSFGRPVAYWPYDKLTKEADLIVIATPSKTEETGEKMDLPGISRNNKPVPGVGINTTFAVIAVLKGKQDLEEFVLFHLREAEPQVISVNGPGLVSFDPSEKKRYLLFLKREADGRLTSLCGQTDPAGAVKDLGVHP